MKYQYAEGKVIIWPEPNPTTWTPTMIRAMDAHMRNATPVIPRPPHRWGDYIGVVIIYGMLWLGLQIIN